MFISSHALAPLFVAKAPFSLLISLLFAECKGAEWILLLISAVQRPVVHLCAPSSTPYLLREILTQSQHISHFPS